MNFITTPIEGLLVIEPKVFSDERGHFFEPFNEKEMRRQGIESTFVQDNESLSHKGVLRGLHFQKHPYEQGKLVRVVRGSVSDVVVDIRPQSKTFGKHFQIELSSENHLMLWIPPGFAHGFLTLEDHTIFLYKVTAYYQPNAESGIIYNDPQLNIDWKISNPLVSPKDRILPSFSEFMLTATHKPL
jgi:dTDP-4-dehydrorhamnose 3,5-epimerase